jgi:hypothetical protein
MVTHLLPGAARRRTTLFAFALGVTILLGGVVVGGTTVALLDRGNAGVAAPPGIAPDAGRITEHLRGLLGLSPEQTASVHGAMARRLAALAALRTEMAGRVADEHATLAAEMKAILSDGQFSRWQEHFETVRRARAHGATPSPGAAQDSAPPPGTAP